jgi:hypothetical protein
VSRRQRDRLDELRARLRDTDEQRTPRESLELLVEAQALTVAETRRALRWWIRWVIRARLLWRRLRRRR